MGINNKLSPIGALRLKARSHVSLQLGELLLAGLGIEAPSERCTVRAPACINVVRQPLSICAGFLRNVALVGASRRVLVKVKSFEDLNRRGVLLLLHVDAVANHPPCLLESVGSQPLVSCKSLRILDAACLF